MKKRSLKDINYCEEIKNVHKLLVDNNWVQKGHDIREPITTALYKKGDYGLQIAMGYIEELNKEEKEDV